MFVSLLKPAYDVKPIFFLHCVTLQVKNNKIKAYKKKPQQNHTAAIPHVGLAPGISLERWCVSGFLTRVP